MPAFSSSIGALDRWHLVNHIYSLQQEQHQDPH
jgi:hypothetical protein